MNKNIKLVLIMMSVSVVSNFLGFGREMILAYKFGASAITDSYLLAQVLPILILGGFLNTLTTGVTPIYSNLIKNKKELASNYIQLMLLAMITLAFLFIILYSFFDEIIFTVLGSTLNAYSLNLTLKMTEIMMFSLIFISIISILGAYLQYNNHFLIVSFSNLIVVNISLIVFIVISSDENPLSMAYGYFFGYLFSCLILIITAFKSGFKLTKRKTESQIYVRESFVIAIPIFLGSLAGQINALIDRYLASTLDVGTISALNYANRIYLMVIVLFAVTISTIIFPKISKMVVNNDKEKIKSIFLKSLIVPSYLLIPITYILFNYSEEIIRFVFERGEFSSSDTLKTAQALSFYSLGILFASYREIIVKLFIAHKETKTITWNAIIMVIFNIVLNLILINKYEHIGLALATSLSFFISIVLLYRPLNKVLSGINLINIVKKIVLIIICTTISGAFFSLIYELVISGDNNLYYMIGVISITIVLSVIIYALLLVLSFKFFDKEEYNWFFYQVNLILKKFYKMKG